MEDNDQSGPSPFRKAAIFAAAVLLAGASSWYFAAGRRGRTPESAAAAQSPFVKGPARILEPAENIYELQIKGSPKFRRQVEGALSLIRQADEGTFLFIRKYVYVISNENRTGFYLDGDKPVAALSDRQALRSLTWCAGLIAHQAFHSYAASVAGKKPAAAPPFPGKSGSLAVAANPMAIKADSLSYALSLEDKAGAFQAKVLSETGAPRTEIQLVRNRKRNDFSTAHDGDYSLLP